MSGILLVLIGLWIGAPLGFILGGVLATAHNLEEEP